MSLFTGAGVAIVTPMNADGSVNYEKLAEILEFQIANETDAIIICGTTGESATLSEEEHSEVIRFCIKTVNHRIPVIAGTGSNCTETAVKLSKEAEAAGADFVGGEELIPKIQNEGWFDFDVVVATPDMMGVVGRLGRVLGPKGLMPNPKAGTVTMDVTKAVNDIKAGKIEYRLDKTNIIHVPVGKASFTDEQLNDNFQSLMGAINKAKPASLKGQYIKSATLTSTMGPGVKLNVVKITQ